MAPNKVEFISRMAEQLAAREADYAYARGLVRTAEVHAEKLVGSPEWDLYQQQLQAMINDAEAALKNTEAQLLNPLQSWDHATLALLKGMAVHWMARRDALKEALLLPPGIIERARKDRDGHVP